MYIFEDCAIDARHPEFVPEYNGAIRTVAIVREEVERFRGCVLSKAYALERQIDVMILWHLFRDRQDGMAAFFEDNILQDGVGFGRKVSLARKIAEDWADDSEKAAQIGSLVSRAKEYRDRVAHWPVKLCPIVTPDDVTVDYRPRITKGKATFALGPSEQDVWLAVMDEAAAAILVLIARIRDFSRSEFADR